MAALLHRLAHSVTNIVYEFVRHARMEDIRHAVDEDAPWSTPAHRGVQSLRQQSHLARVALVSGHAHRRQPWIQSVHITVVAAG